ncbi:MAG: hypothetical protein ABW277_19410 [Longimicrobiaceae bacterium]
MRPTPFVLCLAAGCAALSRSAPVPPEVAELAGCYAMEYGAWGPEIGNGQLRSPADLPTAIRLGTALSGWREGRRGPSIGYAVHTLTPASSRAGEFQAWNLVGKDSVWAGIPVLGGFALHLRREGAELRGEVEAYTDDLNGPGASETRTTATARRISCASS